MTSQTSASGLNFEITWVCLAMRRRQSRDQPFTFFEHSSRLLWFRTVNLIEVDSCAVHRRHLQIKTNLCPVPKLCLLVRIPPNRLLLLREPLETKGSVPDLVPGLYILHSVQIQPLWMAGVKVVASPFENGKRSCVRTSNLALSIQCPIILALWRPFMMRP